MSECVPIASNPRHGERREGSVGRPAGPEVAILLESGELTSAPAGGEGEVCIQIQLFLRSIDYHCAAVIF